MRLFPDIGLAAVLYLGFRSLIVNQTPFSPTNVTEQINIVFVSSTPSSVEDEIVSRYRPGGRPLSWVQVAYSKSNAILPNQRHRANQYRLRFFNPFLCRG